MMINRQLITCIFLLAILKLDGNLCRASIARNYTALRSYNESALSAINDVWIWKYVDEQVPSFKRLVHEESLDERLANIVYTTNNIRLSWSLDFKIDAGSDELNEKIIRSLAGPKVNNELCGKQLAQMFALIQELEQIVERKRNNDTSVRLEERHFRLARVLDSFGSYEAGLLSGRQAFLGSYSQCHGTNLILDSNDTTTAARYCYARLRVDRKLNPSLSIAKLNLETDFDSLFTVGICIPETCHTLSFDQHKRLLKKLVDHQFKLPKSMFMDETLELDSIYCLPDKDSERYKLPFEGKLFVTFLACLIGATVVATHICRIKQPQTSKEQRNSACWKAVEAFDFRKNWNEFTTSSCFQSKRVNLDPLNVIKVFSCWYVVVAHYWNFKSFKSVNSLRSARDWDSSPGQFMMLSGANLMDTFFVITGMIITYISMKSSRNNHQKENSLPIANSSKATDNTISSEAISISKQSYGIIVARYFRIVPFYFIVFWFQKAVFIYFDLGQVSDSTYNPRLGVGACRSASWLEPLTLSAVFQPMTSSCLIQTWYVACDMYFILFIAPLISLMTKRPKLSIALALFVCVLSNVILVYDMTKLDPNLLDVISKISIVSFFKFFAAASHLYTYPQYRICSVIFGSLAGYALFKYNKSNQDWPHWFRTYATYISIALIIFLPINCGLIPILKDYNLIIPGAASRYLFYYIMSGNRVVWSAANAVVFLRMTTDWNNKFLSSNGTFWQTMVKLNYALLLVHVTILMLFAASFTTFTQFSYILSIIESQGIYLISLAVALIAYLVIECPIKKLVDYFVLNKGGKKQSQDELAENGKQISDNFGKNILLDHRNGKGAEN